MAQRSLAISESGSDSDERLQEGGCCGGVVLPRLLTDYRAQKRVLIRSPWLQIPHCTASVLIFLYIICYQLTWNLRFMLTQNPDVAAVGRLQKPIKDWLHCNDEDFDCYMRVEAQPDPYCQPESFGPPIMVNGVEVPNRNVQRCWRNDVHQKLSTSFMIPTLITFIAQSWAPGTNTEDWTTDNVTEYYIENIEAFSVRLFHSFVAEEVGMSGRAENTQGYFSGENLGVPLQHIACDVNCSYVNPRIIEGLEGCGDSNATRNACFSSPWGDVFSVQTILGAVLGPVADCRAAVAAPSPGATSPPCSPTGLHLDLPRPDMRDQAYTYRQAGHSVRIHIDYFNLKDILLKFSRDWDFGVLFKPTPAYKLYFRKVRALADTTVSETEVRHAVDPVTGLPDPSRRILHRTTGIWTTISHEGEIGAFSFRQLLLSLVTGLALFKVANIMVENVLTRIYMRMQDTAHVGMLWHVHKEDRSQVCHKFRQDILNADSEIVDRIVSHGGVEDTDMEMLRTHRSSV